MVDFSAMVHLGLDGSKSASLENDCIARSQKLFPALLKHFDIPHRETSSLMIATSQSQVNNVSAIQYTVLFFMCMLIMQVIAR